VDPTCSHLTFLTCSCEQSIAIVTDARHAQISPLLSMPSRIGWENSKQTSPRKPMMVFATTTRAATSIPPSAHCQDYRDDANLNTYARSSRRLERLHRARPPWLDLPFTQVRSLFFCMLHRACPHSAS